MADRDIIIGRIINVTGMIGVSAGIILFTFAIVLLLFRRGFGFDANCRLVEWRAATAVARIQGFNIPIELGRVRLNHLD
jgi:hypothetical protein